MAIVDTTKTLPASQSDFVYNPDSQLDKDAFMKLFLEELKMQDPTEPMNTEKMLEQTAQLATMEMNDNMQKSLEELSNVLNSTSKFNTISAIGKMADTGDRYINVTDEINEANFDLYFGDDILNGEVIIKDRHGNIIKTFPLQAHTKGVLSFSWDLKDSNGNRVKSDTYEISAIYTTPNGKEKQTVLGAYPIESIRFEKGEPYAKLGSSYVPFNEIQEIYEWQE
ncbi:MAG TPA: flagellar hook capping protein [Nautiliaceae bacterium]|nr:flagellar hook capping protein [Nautiliaceae bacterium]